MSRAIEYLKTKAKEGITEVSIGEVFNCKKCTPPKNCCGCPLNTYGPKRKITLCYSSCCNGERYKLARKAK